MDGVAYVVEAGMSAWKELPEAPGSSTAAATVSLKVALVVSDEPWSPEGAAWTEEESIPVLLSYHRVDGCCTSIAPIVQHPQRAAARRNLHASHCS